MSTEQRVTAPYPASFERDLENARVLVEESPWKENPQKYRKVAEGILRRVLNFDPGNESAKRLLEKTLEIPMPAPEPEPATIRATIEMPLPALKLREAPAAALPPPAPDSQAPAKVEVSFAEVPPRRPVAPPDFSFIVDNSGPARPKEQTKKPPFLLVGLATLGAVGGIALLVTNWSVF